MKYLLLASVALGLGLGCNPVPVSETAAPAPKTPTADTKPAVAPSAAPPVQSQVTSAKPTDNPNRLFQLYTLEKTDLRAPGRKLECWVMDSVGKQQEGMMWLTDKDVRDDQGMIFVFADAQPQSFWMQNTLIPLDIIYIGEDGKVLNIAHGKAKDETSLPSNGPAKYVLELKDGMARRFGIHPGTHLNIPDSLKFKPNES